MANNPDKQAYRFHDTAVQEVRDRSVVYTQEMEAWARGAVALEARELGYPRVEDFAEDYPKLAAKIAREACSHFVQISRGPLERDEAS